MKKSTFLIDVVPFIAIVVFAGFFAYGKWQQAHEILLQFEEAQSGLMDIEEQIEAMANPETLAAESKVIKCGLDKPVGVGAYVRYSLGKFGLVSPHCRSNPGD